MKERTRNIILYSISILFILIIFLIAYLHLKQKLYFSLFWVCYTCMTLISLGIILKKSDLIFSQVIILFIPDLVWVVDFFILLISGNSPLGFAKYFFTGDRGLLANILSLQHFFTVPLGIFALSLMKIKKNYKPLLIAFGEIIIFFLLGFVIPAGYGVNCLPTPTVCTSIVFSDFIPYPLVWLILEFSFITVSYLIIVSLPFLRKIKEKQ